MYLGEGLDLISFGNMFLTFLRITSRVIADDREESIHEKPKI